jgi:hypothetical protein
LFQTLSKALKNIDSHSAIPTHLVSANGSRVVGYTELGKILLSTSPSPVNHPGRCTGIFRTTS